MTPQHNFILITNKFPMEVVTDNIPFVLSTKIHKTRNLNAVEIITNIAIITQLLKYVSFKNPLSKIINYLGKK